MNPYSADKINYHPLHLEALRNGGIITPLHVQLVPTNVCNQRCHFCSYRQPGYSSNETFDERESIPFSKLAELVDDCETMGVRAIQLTGGGEPTCHPQFLPLCEMLLDCGIDLAIVTNGSRWTEGHVDCLRRAKWVRFSIDSGHAATYASMRRVEPRLYGRVRKTIRALTSFSERPTVGVGFVINEDNWREIVPATLAAREDGADNIRLSAVFQNQGLFYFNEFGEQATALCREAESLSTDTFKVINLFGDRVDDLAQGRPDYDNCWISCLCAYVGADMNIYRCCVYAYNHQGLLGSIKDRPFREMWMDPETQRSLRTFDPKSCVRCMFNNKNRAVQAAIDSNTIPVNDPPDHVNFV